MKPPTYDANCSFCCGASSQATRRRSRPEPGNCRRNRRGFGRRFWLTFAQRLRRLRSRIAAQSSLSRRCAFRQSSISKAQPKVEFSGGCAGAEGGGVRATEGGAFAGVCVTGSLSQGPTGGGVEGGASPTNGRTTATRSSRQHDNRPFCAQRSGVGGLPLLRNEYNQT